MQNYTKTELKTSEGESKFETYSSNCTEDDTGVR